MFGKYLTDEPPFEHVYIHGLVRDKDRQKMSKSKGNVKDPLAIIDEFGTDALRIALVFGTAAGNDLPISEERVRGMRNFANKLWNVSRFILMNLQNHELGNRNQGKSVGTSSEVAGGLLRGVGDAIPKPITKADKIILEKLNNVIGKTTKHFENFRFHEGAQGLYHFLWSDLADTYIEASKDQLNGEDAELSKNTQAILLHVLSNTLKLLHPIMPFITEVIWQKLPESVKDSKLISEAAWPKS
jgi:valyl-tRNA synthetase